MGNEIVAVNAAEALPVHSLQELNWLGGIVSGTSLFGQAKPADGLAIVAMCHQERMSWMRFSQTYHWIKGRPAKRADAMLSEYEKLGGKRKIIERSPNRASCVFMMDGNEYESTITWEDAQKEPFVYEGRESDVITAIENGGKYPNGRPLVIKAKYKTPRSRMQMLWARCVSDGVRTICPQCCCGVYTPEEVSDFDEPRVLQSVPNPAPPAEPIAEASATVDVSDVNICPAGALKGCAWKDMDDKTLKSALGVRDDVFTPEMKAVILGILNQRKDTINVESETVKE